MKKIIINSPKHGNKEVFVDNEDFDRISIFKWCAIKTKHTFYATGKFNLGDGYKTYLMHRMILGVTDPKIEVDHEDHNGLNNQKSNIRKATKAQNQRNRKPSGLSKYLGVTWHSPTKKWKARIRVNGVEKYLGLFESDEDAAKAYDKEAVRLYGKFANPNFK